MSTQTDRIPLSFAQQRLWFLFQMDGPSGLYNMPLALRVHGPLDRAALERAAADVVRRHESLRTVFPEAEGSPYQSVLPDVPDSTRLRTIACAAHEVAAVLAAESAYAFDLTAEAPIRFRLLTLAEDEHVIFMLLHHIASDGWSFRVLCDDLGTAYAARAKDAEPDWDPLPVQYGDYAYWQRDLLGDEQDPESLAAEQLAYWREALADLPEELALPTDRPRPAVAGHQGAQVAVDLAPELHGRLAELAAATDTTLFMIAQAAVCVLLSRHGAGTDIPLGSVVAGRGEADLEPMIGIFVNNLVLRADLSGDPAFRDLLGRIRDADLAGYEHADLPFERLVDVLHPARTTGRHPLFQTLVSFDTGGVERLEMAGLDVRPEPLPLSGAKFDLVFHFADHYAPDGAPAGIEAGVEFASDLFDASTARDLAVRLRLLLEAVTRDPDVRIGDVDILTAEERGLILETWNETDTSTGADVAGLRLHEVVSRHAARLPNAVALRFGEESLTYAELELRANQLAHVLAARGARRGAAVSIYLERGLEMSVAILAALKTGAPYTMLDPEFPPERLRRAVADTGTTVVVSDGGLIERLGLGADVARVLVDGDADVIAAEPHTCPDAPGFVEDPACVVFTSGSTGSPKGISIPHAAMVGKMTDPQYASAAPGAVWLASASVSWDVFALEFWAPLLAGATCVLQPGQRPDAQLIAQLTRKHGVTALAMVPGVFGVLVEEFPDTLAGLDQVIVAGEPLVVEPVARALARFPRLRLLDCYGPAETTLFSTWHPVTSADTRLPRIPIGRPVRGDRVYVLDDRLQPVPSGVIGEIYSAGRGVAHGYAGRADLTAERFLADPYGTPGSRMYRTGDLGRWTADGVLDHLGRVDGQVKLRGVRIELGEIEAVLAGHPAVSRAVLALREDRPGVKALVAYVVPTDRASKIDPAALRTHCAALLVEAMVPTGWVQLETFPVNSNGKIDRKALPAPLATERAGSRAPANETEAALARIFAELLAVPDAGVDDGFFDLGGHSLLAVRLAARIRAVLGVDVPVRMVFEAPTPARLAERLVPGAPRRRALTAGPRPARVPLSFEQQRLWFIDQLEGPSAVYNIPMTVRLHGRVDAAALAEAFNDLVARHESLRTVFEVFDDTPWQRVLAPAEARIAVPVVNVSPDDVDAAVRAVVDRVFDLTAEPPIAAALVCLSETESILAIVVHHSAADGSSLAPLWRDLGAAYQARLQKAAPQFDPLPVQYADYALWQREMLDDADGAYTEHLEFWRRTLKGAPEESTPPLDRPRPETASHRGATITFDVPAALHARLVRLAADRGATLFMVLHAGLAALVHRLGAGDDVVLGSPIAGRTDAALEDVIGFFVNNLVLRTDLSGSPSFDELLARTKAACLAAYEHQEVPFERLVEELQPARSRARHPLFQVLMALQNMSMPRLELAGLVAEAIAPPDSGARFDLGLSFTERPTENSAPAGLDGEAEYATDLFDAEAIEQFVARLIRLLSSAAEDPSRRVRDIEILDADELRQLTSGLGDAAAADAASGTFVDLVARITTENPEAAAVSASAESISYAELDRRADALARRLRAAGVAKGNVVAVCLPRGAAIAVALLGVWKAGAVYVPVDPDAADERTRYVVSDAGARLVVAASAEQAGRFGLPVVLIDGEPAGDAEIELSPPAPADLAYIIYTSGSTGRPKGVAVEHRSLANLAHALRGQLGLTPHDRVLQYASFTFDASIWDFVLAWGAGALLRIATEQERPAAVLAALLREERITFATLTPSIAAAMGEPAELPDLRTLVLCGEVLTPEIAARWAPGRLLLNGYGPTEATIATTAAEVRAGEPIAIGRPLPGLRMYVLDDALRPVAPGVVGEIYIGGAGIARGYVGRPGLTAERFVPDPHAAVPGARMYRSGDLGRVERDGRLTFAGRADDQVKIRGVRIEPGEVASAVAACAGVARAAVVVAEPEPGDRRLVGYVVPAAGAAPTAAGLRAEAARRLPAAMVPAAFVLVEQLPVTVNGKLDQAALPAPDWGADGGLPARVHRSPREEVLCGLFAEALGRDTVGIDDDFFALGGHSLLATRLLARIRSALGIRLDLRALFEAPTVAGLAARLEADAPDGALDPLLQLRGGDGRPPLYCVHPGIGLGWPYIGMLPQLDPGRRVYALQAPGIETRLPEPASVEQVAEDYLARIRRTQPEGPYHLLGWSFGGLVAFEIASRLSAAGQEVGLLAVLDAAPVPPRAVIDPDAPAEPIEDLFLILIHDAGLSHLLPPDVEVDRELALEVLRSNESVLADLSEAELDRLLALARRHGRLGHSWQPREPYRGELTLISAVGGPPDEEALTILERWAGYAAVVTEHEIDCDHHAMMRPGNAGQIARIVTAALAADRRGGRS